MNYTPLLIIALTAFVGMWVASGSPIKAGITVLQCASIIGGVWVISFIATV
jgi:hypothetical protein